VYPNKHLTFKEVLQACELHLLQQLIASSLLHQHRTSNHVIPPKPCPCPGLSLQHRSCSTNSNGHNTNGLKTQSVPLNLHPSIRLRRMSSHHSVPHLRRSGSDLQRNRILRQRTPLNDRRRKPNRSRNYERASTAVGRNGSQSKAGTHGYSHREHRCRCRNIGERTDCGVGAVGH
jgi:hypothetical protein